MPVGAQAKSVVSPPSTPSCRRWPAVAKRAAVAPPLHQALDVAAVVRIGQAISAELQLDQLVEQLLRVALHHAGATVGRSCWGRGVATARRSQPARQRRGGACVRATGGQPLGATQEVPVELVQAVAGVAARR